MHGSVSISLQSADAVAIAKGPADAEACFHNSYTGTNRIRFKGSSS